RFFTRNRDAALFAALFLYGLFSSPTPDEISIFEGVIGALLIAAIGLPVLFGVFTGRYLFPSSSSSGLIRGSSLDSRFRGNDGMVISAWSFFILLYLPLAIGILSQHPL